MDNEISKVVKKKTVKLTLLMKLNNYKEYFRKRGYDNVKMEIDGNTIKFSKNERFFRLDNDFLIEPEYILELVKINLP